MCSKLNGDANTMLNGMVIATFWDSILSIRTSIKLISPLVSF
uniref:Uncharacterized protein n=1 Tax=Rhizophora mucronata TaxID=61149 RepID=A0A2P2L1H3_RHIMU